MCLSLNWIIIVITVLFQNEVHSIPASITNSSDALHVDRININEFTTLTNLLPNKRSSVLFSPSRQDISIVNKCPTHAGLLQSKLVRNTSTPFQVIEQLLPEIETRLDAGLNENSVSGGCKEDVLHLITSADNGEQWALQMLDSSGKLPRGILRGNLDFIGQYDECRETVSGFIQSNSSSNHVIRGSTCIAYIKPPSNLIRGRISFGRRKKEISWHLCVPDTCRKDDIVGLIKEVLEQVNFTASRAFCRDQEQPEFTKDISAIISLSIICILMLLLAVGTLIDVVDRYFVTKRKYTVQSKHRSCSTIPGEITNPVFKVDVDDDGTQLDKSLSKPELQVSDLNDTAETQDRCNNRDPLWQRLLLCFSALRNTRKILSVETTKGAIGCIHGIRVISMSWVILGHTTAISFGYVENPALLSLGRDYLKSFAFQIITASVLAVDTFFVLSGVLTAYLFLKETRNTSRVTWKLMIMYYVHRFWRLTPLLMMWLMVNTMLLRYVGDGPTWTGPKDVAICRSRGWWQILLYINNFVKQRDQCFEWSWFLSVDMQFYVLSPLALIPLTYGLNVVGILVITAFVITHMASTGFLVFKLNANMMVNNLLYMDNIYYRPYTRIGPYALGLALGYILLKVNSTVKLSRSKVMLGWMLAAGIAVSVVFTQYDQYGEFHTWSAGGRAVFEAFYRVGWGLVVCWVIFACTTGNGGIINSILSWNGWLPMSRLTYGTYLLHVLIIVYDVGTERTHGYISIYYLASKYLGYCIQAYLLSYASSLLVESPLLGMEKELIK